MERALRARYLIRPQLNIVVRPQSWTLTKRQEAFRSQ